MYEFQVLQFGISLAPCIFMNGVGLIMASGHESASLFGGSAPDRREQAVLQTRALVSYLRALGFLINLKLPGSKSADFITRFRDRFLTEQSYAVSTKGGGFSQLSGSVLAGQVGPFSFRVETAGAHVLDDSSCPSGPPLHVCVPEMGAEHEHEVECRAAFKQTGDDYNIVRSGSDSLGELSFVVGGNSPRQGFVTYSGDDGCITTWMGSSVRGEWSAALRQHQGANV